MLRIPQRHLSHFPVHPPFHQCLSLTKAYRMGSSPAPRSCVYPCHLECCEYSHCRNYRCCRVVSRNITVHSPSVYVLCYCSSFLQGPSGISFLPVPERLPWAYFDAFLMSAMGCMKQETWLRVKSHDLLRSGRVQVPALNVLFPNAFC